MDARAVEAGLQQALALQQRGQLDQAERIYRLILAHVPDCFGALHLLGILEGQKGNAATAEAFFSQAIRINPSDALAHSNLGNVLLALGRPQEALAAYDRALGLKPDFAGACNGRGNALLELGRPREAIASYDRAVALQPDYAEALNNRGNVLLGLKRAEEALADYDLALALHPDYLDAINGRGNVLLALDRPEEALAAYHRALQLQPASLEAFISRGNVLLRLKRLPEALASYEGALAIKPDYPEALYNRGNVLLELKRRDEALASYDRALAIRPDYADALYNRGGLLIDLRRFDDAARCYARLLEVAPGYDYALGYLLYAQLLCCDWAQYAHNVEKFDQWIREGKRAGRPFVSLIVSKRAADQLQCARRYVAEEHPAVAPPIWRGERYGHDRIRLAYVSFDFREQLLAYQIAGVIEHHDRTRIETTAISLHPRVRGGIQDRLRNAFERFVDVSNESDSGVAHLLRELEIDIALDLMGHTRGSRLGIFARRPAPLQVNFNCPGTTGADYIDYIITDRIVVPPEHHPHYAEKVVYLPHTFQPNDSRRAVGGRTPTRAEAGLPEKGFVFCSFNTSYKFRPEMFDVWMRLLRKIEGSVLWLSSTGPAVAGNLRREAGARGVNPERLIFAPRVERMEDHLARQGLADLFLDTLPYNAQTTASDALWSGLPVLTCLGEALPGRVAASVLSAIGMPELITRSLEEYEALATLLAREPWRLRQVRARLADHRQTAPLFDTARYTRHLEAAFEQMWQMHERGEPPRHFAVAAPGTP